MSRLFSLLCVFFVAWLPAYLSTCADEVNSISVTQISDEVVNVQVHVNAYAIKTNDANIRVSCVLPGTSVIDSDINDGIPGYASVIELNQGRFARVEGIQSGKKRVKLDEEVTGVLDYVSQDPLTAQIGRMGKRSFLRLSIKPFDVTETGELVIHTSMVANVRISESVKKTVTRSVESGSYTEPDNGLCLECPAAMTVGIPYVFGGSANDFIARRSVSNDVAWKIIVTEPGLYQITGDDLTVAGVPPAFQDTTTLMISTRDETLPVWTSTSGAMQSNDWIMFYGAALASQVSSQNVYWLTVEDASPAYSTLDVSPIGAVPFVTSSWFAVTYEPRNIFDSLYKPLEKYENWFAMFVRGNALSNLTFATPNPILTGDISVEFTVFGKNGPLEYDPDRRTQIWVGGNFAGGATYRGEERISRTSSVPATVLSPGSTLIQVYQPILTNVPPILSNSVSVYVEMIRLCYQRKLTVNEWPFYFSGPTNQVNMRLNGLSTTNVWLLDISDPCAPVELINYSVQSNAGSWSLEFGNTSGDRRCYGLFRKTDGQDVTSLDLIRFRNLSSTNRQADYLAVAPDDFRAPIYRLLKHRYKNDLTVQIASPEDIYNEFSFGVKDPGAIRQYFGFAYWHYQTNEPTYALLCGNGSFDPLNHLGENDTDLIPTKMGWAAASRTSIDQWFVTVDGNSQDYLPDIKLGRIPASTLTNVEHVVNKLISYETSPTNSLWMEVAMLVADNTTNGLYFKGFSQSNTYVHLQNGGFSPIGGIIEAYLDDTPYNADPDLLRDAINAEIEYGLQFINYIGHGSEGQWAQEDVWKILDAKNRTNTEFPIVSVFTCQNGAFHESEETLAEAILLNEHGGSACFAPATFAIDLNSERIADGYFAALATNRVKRLGLAVEEGFLRMWSYNPAVRELLFYTLLGDPAQQVWGGAEP